MTKENKEIEVVREKLGKAVELATAAAQSIKSDKDYEGASELLVNVKKVGKLVTQEKKKQLDPINAAAKATREFWKPFEQQYTDAENILKKAILTYKRKIDARNARKEATISKNVDEGKLSFEQGAQKMEVAQTATVVAGVQTRKVKKIRLQVIDSMSNEQIVELAKAGYIIWDEVKARRDALAGTQIAGVEVYEEEVVAA